MNRLKSVVYNRIPASKGSNSVVYKGYYRSKKRRIALKRIRNPRKAWTEYRALQRIGSHRNIVRLYAFYRRRGLYYLVISWAGGKPPGIRRKKRWIGRRYAPKHACRIVIRLLRTLHYMHRKKIVYSDINPSNIFIRRSLRIKLIDFGNAKITSNRKHRRKDVAASAYFLAYLLKGNVPRYSKRFPRIRLPRKTPRALRRVIRKATHPVERLRYPNAHSLIVALKRFI